MKTTAAVLLAHILLCCENSECVIVDDQQKASSSNTVEPRENSQPESKTLELLKGEHLHGGVKRGILYSPTASGHHKLHYLPTAQDTTGSAPTAYDSASAPGFFEPTGYRGYHHDSAYGYGSTGVGAYGHYPSGHGGHSHGHDTGLSAHSLKSLLIPLAGIAILGAAAALSTNPVLLQLGVLNGKRRRRRSPHVYPPNHLVKPSGF